MDNATGQEDNIALIGIGNDFPDDSCGVDRCGALFCEWCFVGNHPFVLL